MRHNVRPRWAKNSRVMVERLAKKALLIASNRALIPKYFATEDRAKVLASAHTARACSV